MKLFLTGAAGYIGRVVTARLLKYNDWVTALLEPHEDPGWVQGAEVVRADITRPESLEGIMKHHDTVVHTAQEAGWQKVDRCAAVNREGTRHVVREAVKSGIRRFVHLSSVAVYGHVSRIPIDEDFPLKRTGDPYGDTKLEAELILREFECRDEIDLTVIRPTVVYGPGDDTFLPGLIASIREGVFCHIGSGEHEANLIHVDDLGRFIWSVIHEPGTIGKTFNVTHPHNPSWIETVERVAGELGVPRPKKHLPYALALSMATGLEYLCRFSGRPPRLTRRTVRMMGRPHEYRTDRMERDMSFCPDISFADGIREMLREEL